MRACVVKVVLAVPILVSAAGCGRAPVTGPPTILLGDSICAECGMIVSDERFATATVVEGDRGREDVLFDDFNCQLIFEHKHSELVITQRWSHDHTNSSWHDTTSGWFVRSNEIRSPMASGMAFFADRTQANAFAETVNGRVLSFEQAWMHED